MIVLQSPFPGDDEEEVFDSIVNEDVRYPLVIGVLGERMPYFAWGIGLLAPFALLLIFLRVVTDRLVNVSVQFPGLANQLGGAVFGGLTAASWSTGRDFAREILWRGR